MKVALLHNSRPPGHSKLPYEILVQGVLVDAARRCDVALPNGHA